MRESKSADELREVVRERYGEVARQGTSCCGGGTPAVREVSRVIGYSVADVEGVPAAADLGLGCGNPTALAGLRPGEVVVDLGAGAGIDALIAARKVGPEGRVIGVDMTPDMLGRARRNAVEMGVADYVEFREGLIEELPVVSGSVDVVISNCVVNLSPDKPRVFREAFRVLKPGGRMIVSDLLLSAPLPREIAERAEVYVACVGGAALADTYLGWIEQAGFERIEHEHTSAAPMLEAALGDPAVGCAVEELGVERARALAETVWSYRITAWKPSSTPSPTS